MKKREAKAMLKIEKQMVCLGSKAQARVAAWVASRYAVVPPVFDEQEETADQAKLDAALVRAKAEGGEVLMTTSGCWTYLSLEDLAKEKGRQERDGVLGGPDGIFDMDPGDTSLDDAEMAGHVYGLIRMGLKEGALSHLSQPDRCEAIIRGTGRQDLFEDALPSEGWTSWRAGGGPEKVYEILEQIMKGGVSPGREGWRGILDVDGFLTDNGALRYTLCMEVSAVLLMSVRVSDGLAYEHVMNNKVIFLTERFAAPLTDIIRENTHECMLPMINMDDDLKALYQTGGKERVVDLWNRLRLELGLAYEPPNR